MPFLGHIGEPDVRREVSYEIFDTEIWPKIRGKYLGIRSKKAGAEDPFEGKDPAALAIHYQPSLIWTEIVSFIKGSSEALSSDRGYLEMAQYLELGRKRAPNFQGDIIILGHYPNFPR